MADLIDGSDAPGFVAATSHSGSLELAWVPFVAAELHVWILLVAPESIALGAPSPSALLRELIRVPANALAGEARVYVPVERPLGVTLIARDAAGAPLPAPRFSVRSGPPVTGQGVTGGAAAAAVRGRSESRTTPPGTTSAGRDIPLVFARGKSALPDLAGLARRIADRVPVPPSPTREATGFGAAQRWTLTRFAFAPGGERVLVVRPTFLDAATLASFATAPPPDAMPVPPDADGIVDALTPDGATSFYALLEREPGGRWAVAPMRLSSPPFDDVARPFVLGNVAGRLSPLRTIAPSSEEHAALVAAALRVLDRAHAGGEVA